MRDRNIFVLSLSDFFLSVFLFQNIFQHGSFYRVYPLLFNMSRIDCYSILILSFCSICLISRYYLSKRPLSLHRYFLLIYFTLPHIFLFRVFSLSHYFSSSILLFRISFQSIFPLTRIISKQGTFLSILLSCKNVSPLVSILFSSSVSYRITPSIFFSSLVVFSRFEYFPCK